MKLPDHQAPSALKYDNWSYGDWRQYVAFLDDGSAICCRIASLPTILAMFGFALLALPAMAMFMAYNGVDVIWPRVFETAFVGFVLLAPFFITWLTPWRLIVPLGKKMLPDENGSYWRHFG
jgi:hypothetical protein